MKTNKPRSIKAKRLQATEAWGKWDNGEISGAERNALSAPFLKIAGLDAGQPADVDRVIAARNEVRKSEYSASRAETAAEHNLAESKRLLRNAKRQKVERNQLRTYAKAEMLTQKADAFLVKARAKHNEALSREYTVGFVRNAIVEAENNITSKLIKGELAIRKKSKKSPEKTEVSVQKYRDHMERQSRKAATSRSAKDAIREQNNYVGINRLPGIPWKGGQLRAGTITGETMLPLMAASELADKYYKSTLPASGIAPMLNVRGANPDGKIVETTVPAEIVNRIMEDCRNGRYPDAVELAEWLQEWADENGIDEIDLFADDAQVKYKGK